METKCQVYLLLADILSYPGPGLQGSIRENWGPLKEKFQDCPRVFSSAVEGFLAFLAGESQGAVEEIYTDSFDLKPICYPYVGYHVFGETYKRGAFMAALKEKYREIGLSFGTELPDHLGVILRYLATAGNDPDAGSLVEECVLPALEKMAEGFEDKENPYSRIIKALPVLMRKAEYAGGAVVNG